MIGLLIFFFACGSAPANRTGLSEQELKALGKQVAKKNRSGGSSNGAYLSETSRRRLALDRKIENFESQGDSSMSGAGMMQMMLLMDERSQQRELQYRRDRDDLEARREEERRKEHMEMKEREAIREQEREDREARREREEMEFRAQQAASQQQSQMMTMLMMKMVGGSMPGGDGGDDPAKSA